MQLKLQLDYGIYFFFAVDIIFASKHLSCSIFSNEVLEPDVWHLMFTLRMDTPYIKAGLFLHDFALPRLGMDDTH